MRFLWLLAILACAPLTTAENDPTPERLAFRGDVLSRLETLAEALEREIMLCLFGTRGRVAVVERFSMPIHVLSTTERVRAEPCPDSTLAVWHAHPTRTGPKLGRCAMSALDVATGVRWRFPFTAISAPGPVTCWWSSAQIVAHGEGKLAAVEGQVVR